MFEVTDRGARESFRVVRVGSGYRVECVFGEDCELGFWDYRMNALNKGYAHVRLAHGISSPRTERMAGVRLFSEPAVNWS